MKRAHLFLLFFIISTPVLAYETGELKKVEQAISQHKKKSSELEKKSKANEKELDSIQAKSIKMAKSLQSNANQINSIKEELSDLTASIKIKEMQLEKNKEKSQAIMSSLMRISSVPTDGFVIASDNPQELINTRILLNSAMPSLTDQAQKLHQDIEEIESSKKDISEKKEKITGLSNVSKKEMREIEALLKKKKALKSKLTAEQKKENAELKKLATKASSMKDFIKRLQSRKIKAKPSTKPDQKKPVVKKPKVQPKFTGAKGNMPIAGRISLGYGKKNPQDITNKGWEMEGNANGLVTSPLDGEVLYSGEFGSYDNIVVFDNGNGYNVLLAGMGKVGVDVGDVVKAGEPVGFLRHNPAALYLEVRKDGDLINPVKVIK